MNALLRQRWLLRGLLALVLCWTLYPLWWTVALSFKQPQDFFTAKWLPFCQFTPTLDNWRAEWQNFDDPAGLGRGLTNSLLVGILSSLLSLGLGGLAAYSLAWGSWSGRIRQRLFLLLLLPLVLPPVVTALPFAQLMYDVGLTDTRTALVIGHTSFGLPLAFVLLYGALREVPNDLLDAAFLDGCSQVQTLLWIVAPLLAPLIGGAGILCFAKSWSEFLYAVSNVQRYAHTAPLAIAALLNKDGIEFEYVGSHLVLVLAPPLLLVWFTQRVLVRALSLGAIRSES